MKMTSQVLRDMTTAEVNNEAMRFANLAGKVAEEIKAYGVGQATYDAIVVKRDRFMRELKRRS
jgi:hypothetical protein